MTVLLGHDTRTVPVESDMIDLAKLVNLMLLFSLILILHYCTGAASKKGCAPII